MKTFGAVNLESLPPLLLNDFCVIGAQEQCEQAILYAFNKITANQRVENLILIEPLVNSDSTLDSLHAIASCGCKIYSYCKESHLENCATFSQFGILLIAKT